MCGINGIIDMKKILSEEDRINLINKMNSAIRHRGPDDDGYQLFDYGILGHLRLSIMDLSDLGHQPMCHGQWRICFNGEIFNFIELRSELIKLGHEFLGGSDTEVILHSFDEWGIDSVARFEGMFAFFIVNVIEEKGYLVRDRLGIKPLYYIHDEIGFGFSSEIRALEKLSGRLSINSKAIPSYLSLAYMPDNETPFAEIKKLCNGCILKIDFNNKSYSEERYWSIFDAESWQFRKGNIGDLKELIINSIDKRLIADVPLGLWLSAGLDSTLLASIISKELNTKITTLSLNFDGDFGKFSEFERARSNATILGHDNLELRINPINIFDNLDEVLDHQEEWIGSPAGILYYKLSELTSKHVKVALTGLGGDEIFGGYNRYKALLFSRKLEKTPKLLKQILLTLSNQLTQNRENKIGNYNRAVNKILKSLCIEDIFDRYNFLSTYSEKGERQNNYKSTEFDLLNEIMKADIDGYMKNELLLLSDKLSMKFGLELRVPLIDFRIIENAFSMPSKDRVLKVGSKDALKNWILTYEPKLNLTPTKSGFSLPINPFLKSLGIKYFQNIFEKAQLYEYVDKNEVDICLVNYYKNNRDNAIPLYSLLVLAKWRIRKNL